MDSTEGIEPTSALLQIVRGTACEEELAAVAVTLFSLLARRARDGRPDQEHPVARWRPAGPAAYRAPHSWR